MSMKLPLTDPPFDLNALLGISGTNVVSTTKPGIVSTTFVVNTTPIVSTTAQEALKAEAARRGMSLTAMVKAALTEYLERRPAE